MYSDHSWRLPNSKITLILDLNLLDIFRRTDRVKCYYSPSMMHFVFLFWAELVKVGSMLSCVSSFLLILKTAYWPLPLPFAIIHQTNSRALSKPCCNWWNGFYALLACCFGASSGRKPWVKLDRWLDKKLVVQDISWQIFFLFSHFHPALLTSDLVPLWFMKSICLVISGIVEER